MQTPIRTTVPALGAGYELLTACEDSASATGYCLITVPVVALEIEPAHDGNMRDVVAVAVDGDTSVAGDKAVRMPDGRTVDVFGTTHDSASDWLRSLREMDKKRERLRTAQAVKDLV